MWSFRFFFFQFVFFVIIGLCSFFQGYAQVSTVPYHDLNVYGELAKRSLRNFDRLESEIYFPDNVFPTEHEGVSAGWPGDYEGRIILGLTLQAQATHRTPKYLAELIDRLGSRVNDQGYLGPVMQDSILEQQLSGHGWLLRGLCAYYEWKQDERVKTHIMNIISNLALPTKGYHSEYPIEPGQRLHDVGEASGTTQNAIGKWLLSSDIGCDFIFMDGVIHAYALFPEPAVRELIDEMVDRFLAMDLIAIKAQTHATLTAVRGLLRYYAITHKPYLLEAAISRYRLYKSEAMTENYENYNWFGRPEWTEPCAIVDAFMVATQLWQQTEHAEFLEDAHHIYYNALAHTQRANGGFGLDSCPGPDGDVLAVHADEAYWCCTMRGGEGLAAAIAYSYFKTKKQGVYVPFFNDSEFSLLVGKERISLAQQSGYPYNGDIRFEVKEAGDKSTPIRLYLFAPSWAENPDVSINGKPFKVSHKDGFVMLKAKLKKGDSIRYSFGMTPRLVALANKSINRPGYGKFVYGPLVLGQRGKVQRQVAGSSSVERVAPAEWLLEEDVRLTPVFHVLDPDVSEETGYQKQIIFKVSGQ